MLVAGAVAGQLLIGLSAGYIAYMRGIQKADPLLAVNWYVLLPALGLALSRIAVYHRQHKLLGIAMLFLLPSFALVGFIGAYSYPVWHTGPWYSFLSGALTASFYLVGCRIINRRSTLTTRLSRLYSALYPLLCLVFTIAVSLLPLKYESMNVLNYFGEGLLNSRADDNQISGEVDGRLVAAIFDGWEVPAANPNFVKVILEGGQRLHFSRRYWLRGIVLEWFGMGYRLGEPPVSTK
jgi:hypothetical protein